MIPPISPCRHLWSYPQSPISSKQCSRRKRKCFCGDIRRIHPKRACSRPMITSPNCGKRRERRMKTKKWKRLEVVVKIRFLGRDDRSEKKSRPLIYREP